jgi:hypothetical protein
MLRTISLETSIKKLVRLTAHTLRGKARQPFFFFEGATTFTATSFDRQTYLSLFQHFLHQFSDFLLGLFQGHPSTTRVSWAR